jgi:hypothetical protein
MDDKILQSQKPCVYTSKGNEWIRITPGMAPVTAPSLIERDLDGGGNCQQPHTMSLLRRLGANRE